MAKINDEQLRNIPVSFSKIKEYQSDLTDSRFTEVLIKILHLGRNYNGSIFKREVVENAIPTLANTPILGFIEPNKEDEDDFSNHRLELVKDNGVLKMRYMGHAYGVISESQANEAYFEDELCSDGISRTYLYVKGLLFNKFDYVIDMFKSHNGSYNQSMELSENYTGTFDKKEGGFVFDSFQFDGACIITCDPAMIDSEITTNFSVTQSKIAEEIENKLNEFAKYFSKKEEEQINMDKQEVENKEIEVKENFSTEETPVEQQEQSASEVFKKEENTSNESFEEKEAEKVDEYTEDFAKEDKQDEESKSEDKSTDEEPKEEMACGDKEKKYSLTFSLSHEDIANQLYNKLWDMSSIENTCYYIMKTMDSYFVYVDCMTGQLYEQAYTQTDDSIAFTGERKEVFDIIVDKETKDAMTAITYSKLQKDLEEAQNKIQEYSKANEELLKFQLDVNENKRKVEIDKVISSFSKINELDLENYKQKAYKKELSKEQLEDKLYAELGKMNFSKLTGEKVEEIDAPTNYSVNLEEQYKCPYEGCEDLFK